MHSDRLAPFFGKKKINGCRKIGSSIQKNNNFGIIKILIVFFLSFVVFAIFYSFSFLEKYLYEENNFSPDENSLDL